MPNWGPAESCLRFGEPINPHERVQPGPINIHAEQPVFTELHAHFLYFIITMIKQGYNSQFIVNMATQESITASRHISHCTFMQQTYVRICCEVRVLPLYRLLITSGHTSEASD
jgi:hypothetical protein